MEIKKGIQLNNYSTFKIGGEAKYFVVVENYEDLIESLKWARENSEKVMILGSGSNSLFSDAGFSGLVLKNEIKGIELVSENDKEVILKASSGELWSKLVYYSIERNLYGLENTFYIPGTVGAAPVQNIGAYGVELKDIFSSLEAIDLETYEKKVFTIDDCQFAYRDSIFKKEFKNKYFILSVNFKLSKEKKFNLNYPDIQKVLSERNILEPTLKELVEIIMEIRDSKLPNPGVLPSAGSFFKNPVITSEHFVRLQEKFPDIKSFPDEKGIKIPAGWLIEQCGFKGQKFGAVGVYEKQALIIVNYGGAKQKEVLDLVKNIRQAVKNKFEIDLQEEVNIL